MSPKMLVTEVMRIGRNRSTAPSRTALIGSRPSSRRRLMASINTMALSTATPTRRSRPIKEGTPSASPLAQRETRAPETERGTVTKTTRGWLIDSNWAAMTA